MAFADIFPQLDDQSIALQLQLEELGVQRERQTGKWIEGSPPDFVLAFDYFEDELKGAITLAEDLKFAHSIAKAVDSDAMAIEELTSEETQCAKDRDLALSLNGNAHVPSKDATDTHGKDRLGSVWVDWDHVLRATEASTFSVESGTTVAGPSAPYAHRQRAVLDQLPQLKVDCVVCGESFHPHTTVRLGCGDVYCKACLKSFFLRVTKDESLFPPKCHRKPIDIAIIEAAFSAEELAAYRRAELEFTSTNRVYCADTGCGKFIPMPQRNTHYASCEACGAKTCMHCKAPAHDGFCPKDITKQSLVDFAGKQGWKTCFGCGELVERFEGCDHMTCRCKAEFCYRCGVKWKNCGCTDWEPEQLNRRAQQVVDREAVGFLEPRVRRQRVVDMVRELRTNHECNHSGRFTRIEGSRRGKVCEICGARHWKYILSCKRCHMLACEDCRRHRL